MIVKNHRLLATSLLGLGLSLGLVANANAQTSPGIIDNGTVQLGIWSEGALNVPGYPSTSGTFPVGLRYLPTGNEATAPGCLCEGWGVSGTPTGGSAFSGYAGVDLGGFVNVTPMMPLAVSGTGFSGPLSTGSQALSVVTVNASSGPTLKVSQNYVPSVTPNLYENQVTITNIGTVPVDNLVYRRAMDWDVEPTAFNEYSTIQWTGSTDGSAANKPTALLDFDDNGFSSVDPLVPISPPIGPGTCSTANVAFTDCGPTDHGAVFDFGFGTLAAGQTQTFSIFYGAAGNTAGAYAALSAVGAELWSLGKPSTPGNPASGEPNTFIFAFKGVGGTPITPTAVPEPGSVLGLLAIGALGVGSALKRKLK